MLKTQQWLNEIKSNNVSDDYVIRLHHLLMKEYGWISFDEFKKLPLVTCMNLVRIINEERETEQREYDKIKAKRR